MIYILDPQKVLSQNNALGPVTSSQFYSGKSRTFHPQGLFSEELFGLVGSSERKKSISWIDLNTSIIHPLIFDVLQKRVEKKIQLIISGQKNFKLTPEGYLEEDENGKISGLSSFHKNINSIKFRPGKDDIDGEIPGDRNRIIKMLETYKVKNLFFMNKLIVISPEYRPIQYLELTNETTVDELSNLYKKVIMLSNQLRGVSGSLYDILSYNMQLLIRDLYELIKVKTSKKSGIIRSSLLGRTTDFSGRSVISPDPKLNITEVGIPFDMIAQLFEPYIIYGILNSKYSGNIPIEFHKAVKEFLGKEKSEEYNLD